MTKDEAIHKALKVLNCLNNGRVYETAWVKGAINACEEALEQPAQEPVGYVPASYKYNLMSNDDEYPIGALYLNKKKEDDIALYTRPAPSLQGLSDDEILIICAKMAAKLPNREIDLVFARAIEQALKEKNHGTT